MQQVQCITFSSCIDWSACIILYVDANVPAYALQEKRLASERCTEKHEELSVMKDRSEREVQSLKEHLRLAMAALQEGQKLGNSLDH